MTGTGGSRTWGRSVAKGLAGIALVLSLSACTFFRPGDLQLPNPAGIQRGETVAVKGDENIYAIALAHNVSMRDLIALNGLKPPFDVSPGQKLVLPVGGPSFSGGLPPPEPAPLDPVEKNNLAPIVPAPVSVQPIDPPVFAPTQSNAPVAFTPVQPAPQQAAPLQTAPQAVAPAPEPKAQAAVVSPPSLAAATPSGFSLRMKWPVQGPILSSFGPKTGGLSNDGINIGAPKGSPVVASASGTVVYAGNDMKGFGNLVLIKHPGNYVTAYAHLDRVLVKRDAVVLQGDMIGTVGKTGNVSTPQLHFEIRESGKAVDPARHIKDDQ
ncbi:MAG: M23 family metallopeptidase [Alphaproteobacteria bacterium]|nr:M23 family metallopeptidase [Alphaproteobacteria bacterium]